MARLTKRQRIRVRSYLNLAIVLLVLIALASAAIAVVGAAARSRRERQETVSDTFVPPVISPVPTETPEPVEEDPLPDVDITRWNFRLVRSDTLLEPDFAPELTEIERGERFDARAASQLTRLIEDARAAGYGVYCCSGYRSYDTQYWIYWNHIERYEAQGMTREEAEAATLLAVNYPGGSEHQLGLAMDLLEYENQDMEPYIGGSGLMLWLEEHCAEYGFVIRYPDGKTDITGVEYEPWHLRYVGPAAEYIMEHDLCLEEFLALYE